MEPEDTKSPELVLTATSTGDANSTVKSANITNSTSQGAVPTRTKGINSTNQGAVANLPTGIKAPTVVKRRGQPRGHELTTIGVPAKKAESLKKPCSFSKLHVSKKEEGTCYLQCEHAAQFLHMHVHTHTYPV